MNSLPMTGDIVEWGTQFRDALQQLLGRDIDRISVNINTSYNPCFRTPYAPVLEITQCVDIHPDENVFVSTPDPKAYEAYIEGKAATLVAQMQQAGFAVHEYEPPYYYNFWDHTYLGTILLFRRRGLPPISEQSLATVSALHPFIHFALCDAVARYAYAGRALLAFNGLLGQLCRDLTLKEADKEILTLRLLGFRQTEIATRMDRHPKAIGRRLRAILRKAGVRSSIELFTRRLMPDLEEMIDSTLTPGVREKGGKRTVLLPWSLEEKPDDGIGGITVF